MVGAKDDKKFVKTVALHMLCIYLIHYRPQVVGSKAYSVAQS